MLVFLNSAVLSAQLCAQAPVAYVPQHLLWAPELGGELPSSVASLVVDPPKSVEAGTAWSEVFGGEPMRHPFVYILFLGQDARGDYVPCR
jgi:hypothetical protein